MTAKRDYVDYDDVSGGYDAIRKPIGLKIIIEYLSNSKVPLNKMYLISIGCGVGGYEVELAKKVKEVYGIDISSGMIRKAKKKSEGVSNIKLCEGDAINLPFGEGEFDAVLFNQSLHHVGNYEEQIKALTESYKVVKEGGILIIQTCGQDQLEDGYWYQALIPRAQKEHAKKIMPINDLINSLKEIGFEHKDSIVPYDELIQGKEQYLNVDGIFDKKWRGSDSFWGVVTESELKSAQEKIKGMKIEGTIDKYIEDSEEKRKKVGQVTFVYAMKV